MGAGPGDGEFLALAEPLQVAAEYLFDAGGARLFLGGGERFAC
jgi:hypothetical protein